MRPGEVRGVFWLLVAVRLAREMDSPVLPERLPDVAAARVARAVNATVRTRDGCRLDVAGRERLRSVLTADLHRLELVGEMSADLVEDLIDFIDWSAGRRDR